LSKEKEKVEKLTERIDELLIILNNVAEDLRQISGSLKSFAVSHSLESTEVYATVTPDVSKKEKLTSLEDVKMTFTFQSVKRRRLERRPNNCRPA